MYILNGKYIKYMAHVNMSNEKKQNYSNEKIDKFNEKIDKFNELFIDRLN